MKVVVPGKALLDFNKVLEDSNEEVDIVLTDTQVIFRAGYLTFYTRLLEGNYPDVSRLIPTELKTTMVMDSKELADSVDRASILASSQGIRL